MHTRVCVPVKTSFVFKAASCPRKPELFLSLAKSLNSNIEGERLVLTATKLTGCIKYYNVMQLPG